MKDVTINDNHPKTLLLQKHIEYIASYGVNKDEFVSNPILILFLLIPLKVKYLTDTVYVALDNKLSGMGSGNLIFHIQ